MSTITQIPITPSLKSGVGVITDKRERIAEFINHVLSNPGKEHQTTEHEMTSIRQLVFLYEQQPQSFCTHLQTNINQRIRQYFITEETDDVLVDCSYTLHSDQSKYDVIITISGTYMDENGAMVEFVDKKMFEITSDNQLKINSRGEGYAAQQ